MAAANKAPRHCLDKKNLVYALQRIGQIEDSAALGDQRRLQRAHGGLELAVARSRAASFYDKNFLREVSGRPRARVLAPGGTAALTRLFEISSKFNFRS